MVVVQIDDSVKEVLLKIGKYGESYTELILRLSEFYVKNSELKDNDEIIKLIEEAKEKINSKKIKEGGDNHEHKKGNN